MNTETVPGSPSASPAPPSASPAPKASDRKLSKSPYLSLGTVQETGELDFSDFEKAGGGGVKKGIFRVRSIPGSRMILFDQASGVGSNKFRFSTLLYFVEWYVS